MDDKQTVLVTGAAGFIGARTAQMLLDAGYGVVGIDNMNDYYEVRLKEHRLSSLLKCPCFSFRKLDIEDMPALKRLFGEHRFSAVLNLAARAGVRHSMENPFVYMTTNAVGTLNLLECMRKGGVKKFVLASTSSLYAGQKMPFVETMPVNEPISPYAASKKAAEAMAYTYHHLYGIDVTVVRYFTVYGPAGRPDMSIFRFIKWIDEGTPIELFGDGSQSRDFTYIDDIARGTIAAMKPLGYEIINLGGGNRPIRLVEIISSLERIMRKQTAIICFPRNNSDMESTAADISKAKTLLGWSPRVTPEQGYRLTIDWHISNRRLTSALIV